MKSKQIYQGSLDIALIKKLREITGLGLSSCKDALIKNHNDFSKSLDWLKINGFYGISSKQHRTTKEGVLSLFQTNKKVTVIEVRTETDFVCKNSKFLELVNQLSEAAHQIDHEDVNSFLTHYTLQDVKVSDLIKKHIAIIGENIIVKRIQHIRGNHLSSYIHNKMNSRTGRIVSVVSFDGIKNTRTEKLSRDLAMHIAASRPLFLNRESVDPVLVKKEETLLRDQATKEGKSSAIIEKMIQGRINKFYESIVLLDQVFVVDCKTKIYDLINDLYSDCNFKIHNFLRLEVGEEISSE